MSPNYIALAVPFFFLFIAIEILVARRRKLRIYRLSDALSDLACGTSQQVLGLFSVAFLIAGYAYFFNHHRLWSLPSSGALPWLAAFFGVEFFYYWWHRMSHEVNLLWAAHIVHHQSEDYNLAVALRQSILTDWTTWPFYLPLAFFGVPPLQFINMKSASTLYQFWIHTELIGRLGPVEKVLNTPALHRVHHAINPRYLDKNYGATLMVFDQVFGTYEPETEAPVYGITKPLNSFNPMWAQLHYWLEMTRSMRDLPRLGDKLLLAGRSPAWRPKSAPPYLAEPVSPSTFRKYDPRPRRALARYAVAEFGVAMTAGFLLMLFTGALAIEVKAVIAALVFMALLASSALLERRRWAIPVAAARLGLTVIGAVALWRLGRIGFSAVVVTAAATLLFSLWLAHAQRLFAADQMPRSEQ